MEVTKRKALRNKLMLGMGVGFLATMLWVIFILKLLEKGTISTVIASISIIGVFLFIFGGIGVTVRFFMGKMLHIFSGIQDMTNETLDMGANKLAERNDEIGEMARAIQETIASNTILQAEQVADMKDKIDAIGNAIERITENIEMLAQSAELMKNYDELAERIMGEHGKGFAVVAEEIRALADQSRESTEQIEKIVAALLDNSAISVEITKEVSEAFLKQNEKIHETEVIFSSLNSEIGKVSGSVKEITGEVEDLNAHTDVIETGISTLTDSAQQNADSAEKTTENVEEFRQIVDECNRATETVVNVSEELVGYIKKFGVDSIKERIMS